MDITVIGTGYVGIVTAVGLAVLGHNIHCVDIDKKKIQSLLYGRCPIYEKDIEEKLHHLSYKNLLHFSVSYRCTDKIFFLTVNTPVLENGVSDLSQLFSAIDKIMALTSSCSVIIIKSTVPIGTHKKVVAYLKHKSVYHEVVSNPEFLREGNALHDFLNPDRIIIGTNNKYCTDILNEIYKPLLMDKKPHVLVTDPNTAELIKHTSNAFLANKIAFINECADLCEEAEANIDDLSLGVGLDKRIGKEFLQVGPGFGGSCLPKDIRSLNNSFHEYGMKSIILESVILANEYRFQKLSGKIVEILGGVENKIICMYGLTFKANTDDTRNSPAWSIVELLAMQNAIVHCYDPRAQYSLIKNAYNGLVKFYNDPQEAIYNAEALIIATEWKEFRNIDFDQIKINGKMKSNILIDLRNIFNINFIQNKGFKYYCLGKHLKHV